RPAGLLIIEQEREAEQGCRLQQRDQRDPRRDVPRILLHRDLDQGARADYTAHRSNSSTYWLRNMFSSDGGADSRLTMPCRDSSTITAPSWSDSTDRLTRFWCTLTSCTPGIEMRPSGTRSRTAVISVRLC